MSLMYEDTIFNDDAEFQEPVMCVICEAELDNDVQIYKDGATYCEQCHWDREEE